VSAMSTSRPVQLYVCGHLRSRHEDPANGDSRCLAVEDPRDLLSSFDDGRERAAGYCACMRFRCHDAKEASTT
jgi:hypothetical protein